MVGEKKLRSKLLAIPKPGPLERADPAISVVKIKKFRNHGSEVFGTI